MSSKWLMAHHRWIFLLVEAVILLIFMAFYFASTELYWQLQHTSKVSPISHDSTSQCSLTTVFTKYLDPICLQNASSSNSSYPSDCSELLQLMMNITISLQLDSNEIEIFAQRIEYLSRPNHLKQPILYIHIPKTGGTGFGKWLESHSQRRTVHIWVPDGMNENMFDNHHYPDRYKRRLNRFHPKNKQKHHPYPEILYGHNAYGFDTLFLNPEQLNELGANNSDIIWKSRINYTYITILRNPLSRVPSHFFYQKTGIRDENHKWTEKGLFEWISWFEESSECSVQFISGCHQRAWYNKKYTNIWNKTYTLNPWPRREINESPDIFNGMNITFDQYKIARIHLLEMGWIGLTEYLSESVKQFKVFMNIHTNEGSHRDNVNQRKPSNKLLEGKVMDKLKEYNKYDLELWNLGYVLYLQQQIVIKYGMKIHQ